MTEDRTQFVEAVQEFRYIMMFYDIRKKFFYSECGEKLQQLSQRDGGYPFPGNIRGQDGVWAIWSS